MKFYLEGDKGKALCEHCKRLVSTTYERRHVPFSDGQGEAKDILAATCDECGLVVSIPAQSTPAIKQARARASEPIEAKMPFYYLEMLDQVMFVISNQASVKHRKLFLSYFLHRLAPQKEAALVLKQAHDHVMTVLFQQRPRDEASQGRLSMKVSASVVDDMRRLELSTHMNRTQLLKSTICRMQEDVVFTPNPAVISELKDLAKVAM